MQENRIAGTLVFFGEPAEKVCGSKPFHAKAGYYDELDAAFSFHPAYMLPLSNTCARGVHCGANWGKVYTFLCDRPQDWNVNANAPIPLAHGCGDRRDRDAVTTVPVAISIPFQVLLSSIPRKTKVRPLSALRRGSGFA